MDLQALPITSLPTALKLDDALEIAHGASLDALEEALDQRSSVLVTCPRELSSVVLSCLRARARRATHKNVCKLVAINGQTTGESSRSDPIVRMLEQLREALRAGVDSRVLVLTDLDALLGEGDSFDRSARAAIPMLFEDPGVVFLAFHDPIHALSTAAAPLFRAHVTLRGISAESLSRLVTQREARAMHASELDALGLHRFVAGLNVLSLRRALEDLGRHHEAPSGQSRRAECYRFLRGLSSDGLTVPSESFERDVAGYSEVKQVLTEELVAMHLRRASPTGSLELHSLLETAPRSVRLKGPEGTGKSLLARCVAHALSSVIVELDALALPRGDRERSGVIREAVARARRAAPSVLLIDHQELLTPGESQRLLTETSHVGREENVLLMFLHHDEDPSEDKGVELDLRVSRPASKDFDALVAHHARRLGLADAPSDIPRDASAHQIITALRARARRSLREGL